MALTGPVFQTHRCLVPSPPRDAVILAHSQVAEPGRCSCHLPGLCAQPSSWCFDELISTPRHPAVCVISSDSPPASWLGAPASDRRSPHQHQDGDLTAGSFNQPRCSTSPCVHPHLSMPPLPSSAGLDPLASSVFAHSLSQIEKNSQSRKRHRLTIPWMDQLACYGELSVSLQRSPGPRWLSQGQAGRAPERSLAGGRGSLPRGTSLALVSSSAK